jgi:hypothetical protein
MKLVLVLFVAVVGVFGVGAGASALRVDDPVGAFTDSQGNAGYVEVASDDGSGALFRGCNENEATPGGDDATGYIWVNPSGEDTTPTYGNNVIGAGDDDGEGVDDGDDTNGTEGDDCP